MNFPPLASTSTVYCLACSLVCDLFHPRTKRTGNRLCKAKHQEQRARGAVILLYNRKSLRDRDKRFLSTFKTLRTKVSLDKCSSQYEDHFVSRQQD
ncbi:hypothetical protein Pfo_010154 [Paulownia fortunei]|nr:hypothetical protein Pfo_010154 [Paulownia fortunei]